MTAPKAGAAMTADGVERIDEDDAGRVSLGLIEKVANTRSADAHEHLDEFRPTNRKERHARLAGDRLGEKRLAGARGSDQQDALRNPSAQRREFLRVLQELDDLFQLFLGFIHARHVKERHTWAGAAEHPRAALPKVEGLIVGTLG